MTSIGVRGSSWRARVDERATITLPDGAPLRWAVAADDRWHDPVHEATLRQRLIDGAPVVETKIKVPDGDVVQRTFAVAAQGGAVVLEFTNDSSLPVAVAFNRADVVGRRAASSVPVQGIDLGPDAVAHPIGHHCSITVAVPIGGSVDWASLPSSVQVIKGWIMQSESGMSARLGDLDEQLVTARCNVLLSDPPSHPIDALLWAAERVQLGDPAGDMVDSVVEWVDEVGKQHRRDSHHANALVAAALVLAAAGEPRASCDAVTVVQRGSNLQTELGSLGAARWLGSLRAGLIDDRNGLMLFGSAPSAWVGRNVEVRDLVTLHGTVSYALRWHGDRPALLWEQSGQSPLRCGLDPTFVSRAVRGEELLAAPTCT